MKHTIRSLIRTIARPLRVSLTRRQATQPSAEQLTFDHLPPACLPFPEALSVRSAEYWLLLGQPDRALDELDTLPETARQQPWPLRVRLAAHRAATTLAA